MLCPTLSQDWAKLLRRAWPASPGVQEGRTPTVIMSVIYTEMLLTRQGDAVCVKLCALPHTLEAATTGRIYSYLYL